MRKVGGKGQMTLDFAGRKESPRSKNANDKACATNLTHLERERQERIRDVLRRQLEKSGHVKVGK